MAEVAIIVLMGLPGAGKSTLCRELCALKQRRLHIVHVDFDSLMPGDVEKTLIEESGKWKQFRGYIFQLVQLLLYKLLGKEANQVDLNIPRDLELRFAGSVCVEGQNVPTIILIDDNMYYRSMRFDYHKLARDTNTSFGIIYPKCSLATALQQNSSRERKVAEEVIHIMAEKLQEPQENWEGRHVTLDAVWRADDVIDFVINDVLPFPVETPVDVDAECRELARIACSESAIHQSDQILRKLVSGHMKEAMPRLNKEARRLEAAKVNEVRLKVIEDMRKGKVTLEPEVSENVRDSAKNVDSPLYRYVAKVFLERLAAYSCG